MDIITQRFIAIGNKLLAELRLLRDGVEKLVGAVHDSEEAKKQQRQQQPPVLRAELQIPEAEEREASKYRKKHHRVQVWIAAATTLTFVAAAVYAAIAAYQLHATKEAAYSAQRPWVSGTKWTLTHEPVDNSDHPFVRIMVVNSGDSPAINIFGTGRMYILPDGSQVPPADSPHTPIRGILAPGQVDRDTWIDTNLLQATAQEITDYRAKRKKLYVRAIVGYCDSWKKYSVTVFCISHAYGVSTGEFSPCGGNFVRTQTGGCNENYEKK